MALLFPGIARNEGVVFEKPDWKEVVKKAQKENKLIFVDCYTSWCGPCKMLAKDVFPQKAVGDFYNQHFVSVKFDIEKDADGKQIGEKYKPTVYPTLLFIDPKTEEVVHQTTGAGNAEETIAIGKSAIDPENNLSGMERRYANGERGHEFLESYLGILRSSGLSGKYKNVTDQYLNHLTEEQLCEPANWEIFAANVNNPFSPVFGHYMALEDKLYTTVPKEEVNKKLAEKLFITVHDMTQFSFMRKYTAEEKEQFVAYLRSIYFDEAPALLAILEINACKEKNDYPGMWNRIKLAYNYNVFTRESAYLDYKCIFDLLSIHKQLKDHPESLKEVVTLCDRLLAKGHSMDDYQVKLMTIKENVLGASGDQAGANTVKEQRRRFEEALKEKE